jgi:hypothetical protein
LPDSAALVVPIPHPGVAGVDRAGGSAFASGAGGWGVYLGRTGLGSGAGVWVKSGDGDSWELGGDGSGMGFMEPPCGIAATNELSASFRQTPQ